MKTQCSIMGFLVCCIFLFCIDTCNASEVCEDNFDTFDNVLRSSDLIVMGTVIDSDVVVEYDFGDTIVLRNTILSIEKIIASKTGFKEKIVKFSNVEDITVNGKCMLMYKSLIPELAKRYIAILSKTEDDSYKMIYRTCGLIELSGGKLTNANENSDSYINKIQSFLSSSNAIFNGYRQPIYSDPIEKIAKTAVLVRPTLRETADGYYFRPISADIETTDPLSITWYVNPSEAKNDSGGTASWNEVQAVVAYACSVWSAVNGANVSINLVQYAGSRQDGGDYQTITFESGTGAPDWGVYNGEDIIINSTKWWDFADPNGDGDPIYRTITHEMGHAIGLGDMAYDDTSKFDDPSIYNGIEYHVMFHNGSDPYGNPYPRAYAPINGDKAGVIYVRPDFSESPGIDVIYSTDTMGNMTSSLTIPQGRTIEFENQSSGNPVRFASGCGIDVYGQLSIFPYAYSAGGSYTPLTITSLSSEWDGIEVKNTGRLKIIPNSWGIPSYFDIENAVTGLYLSNSSALDKTDTDLLTITDCETGIYVYNCSPDIHNVKIIGIDTDEGIEISGSQANPDIYKVAVGASGDSPDYGLVIYPYTDATIRYSNLAYAAYDHLFVGYGASAFIDTRHNNIVSDNAGRWAIYCSELQYQYPVDVFQVFFDTDPYLEAEDIISDDEKITNWPYRSLSSYSNGAPKISMPVYAENPLVRAEELEHSGNVDQALALYKDIIKTCDYPPNKRNAIKSIMRICEKNQLPYNEIRDIITQELATVKTLDSTSHEYIWYRPSLDYLMIELDIQEAKRLKGLEQEELLRSAANKFEQTSSAYNGEPMEVEMLARVANIYGDMLNDPATAKQYANRAAQINPGQPVLFAAYRSAKEKYNPDAYEDIYGLQMNKDNPEPPIEPQTEKIAENSVSVFPNPANPVSNISYSIAEPSQVKLDIYSITGQKVAALVDDYRDAGVHTAVFDGSNLASGLYLYRFQSNSFRTTGRLMIIK